MLSPQISLHPSSIPQRLRIVQRPQQSHNELGTSAEFRGMNSRTTGWIGKAAWCRLQSTGMPKQACQQEPRCMLNTPKCSRLAEVHQFPMAPAASSG